jgi:hypothetical protein
MTIHYTTDLSKRFVKLKYDGLHYIGEGETQTLAQVLGFRNKAVFECLALHQNELCIADLTIEQIAIMLNTSEGTIKSAIKELEQVKYEGKPILLKTQVGRGRNKQNNYEIMPNPLVSCFGEQFEESLGSNFDLQVESLGSNFDHTKERLITKEKELKNKELEDESMREKMTKKEIVSYFNGLLKDKGITKRIHYPVVYKKMENQNIVGMLHELKNNEIKRTLEVIVEEYGQGKIKSNLIQYPLDINVLTRKWVVEKAIQIMKTEKETEKEKESQIEKQSVVAEERQDKAIQSIMSRIKKGGK